MITVAIVSTVAVTILAVTHNQNLTPMGKNIRTLAKCAIIGSVTMLALSVKVSIRIVD